jgi:hypothetical protein
MKLFVVRRSDYESVPNWLVKADSAEEACMKAFKAAKASKDSCHGRQDCCGHTIKLVDFTAIAAEMADGVEVLPIRWWDL